MTIRITPARLAKMTGKPRIPKPIQWRDSGVYRRGGALIVAVPIQVVSESNRRSHWAKRLRRSQEQRAGLQIYLPKPPPPLPVVVTLTRYYRPQDHEIDSDDNLREAFKAIKDYVSDWLLPGLPPGKADGDKRITWHYDQLAGHEVGVSVIVGNR